MQKNLFYFRNYHATHNYYAWHSLYFKGFYPIYYVTHNYYARHNIKNKRELITYQSSLLSMGFEFVCKPSSVVYGHLSRLAVANKLKRCSRYSVGRTALLTEPQSCSGWGLHGTPCYHGIGELLPRLSILTILLWRFISVALSLKSPSPDVIRHPVLCCSDFPHGISAPRPYNKLKSLIIITYFLKKCTLFPCFYEKKVVKYY